MDWRKYRTAVAPEDGNCNTAGCRNQATTEVVWGIRLKKEKVCDFCKNHILTAAANKKIQPVIWIEPL